jgi:hypothetical protein
MMCKTLELNTEHGHEQQTFSTLDWRKTEYKQRSLLFFSSEVRTVPQLHYFEEKQSGSR